MTSEGSPNGTSHRRSSITQAALSQLFQRGSSTIPNGGNGQANGAFDSQRRRLSVTTIGLSGTSPTNPPSFNIRRGSMSANSDSIDESAIEDEEMPGMSKTLPNTPFVRRMSFGGSTIRGYRPGGNSPGNDQQGFNWSEQLRSRAESSVTGARPSLSLASSPPRAEPNHDRARSISDMMQPPVQTPTVLQPKQEPRKPDAFQERILKGDFYMD